MKLREQRVMGKGQRERLLDELITTRGILKKIVDGKQYINKQIIGEIEKIVFT